MTKTTLSKVVLPLSLLALAACSKSSSSDSSTSSGSTMTVSGTLATGSVSTMSVGGEAKEAQFNTYGVNANNISSFDITQYGVRCVTLSGTPQAGEGSCASDGSFSLSLASATNVPIGCFVISGSGTSASIVATLAFQGTSTGIDGSTTREGSYVAGDGTSGLKMGAITLDLSKGLAVVPKSQVTATGGTGGATLSGTFADMSGDWTIHAMSSVPTGYVTAGASGNDGPSDGMVIHFGYYTATDGSSNTHHGLSIWESASAFAACGSGEGVTLPSGWTPASGSSALTAAMSVSTTFPSPAATTIQSYGGQVFANLPSAANGQACSAIISTYSSSGSWTNSSCTANNSTCANTNAHWGLAPAEAQFYCAMNGVWNMNSGCSGEFNVDWANLWSAGNPFTGISWNGSAWTSSGTQLTADTSDNNAVKYFGGKVRFNKNPKKRFMMNELIINGATGTLTDHHDFTNTACSQYGSKGECTGTQVTCHIQENSKLTITQTDSTHANVELVQVTGVSPTDDTLCTTDTNAHISKGQSKWMFTISKQLITELSSQIIGKTRARKLARVFLCLCYMF